MEKQKEGTKTWVIASIFLLFGVVLTLLLVNSSITSNVISTVSKTQVAPAVPIEGPIASPNTTTTLGTICSAAGYVPLKLVTLDTLNYTNQLVNLGLMSKDKAMTIPLYKIYMENNQTLPLPIAKQQGDGGTGGCDCVLPTQCSNCCIGFCDADTQVQSNTCPRPLGGYTGVCVCGCRQKPAPNYWAALWKSIWS